MPVASKAQGEAKPKYMIVTNMTVDTQAIVPDEQERWGKEIIVRPWDSIAVRNYAEWDGDQNLQMAVERGFVHVSFSDTKPRAMPQGHIAKLQVPLDRSVCADLVYGSDERFEELVASDVSKDEKRQEFIDYYRERFPVILEVALDWLRAWGPPETLKGRATRIEQRLVKIRRKTASE